MAFPAAPADGDQHTEGAITYQYSTADLTWIKIDPEETVAREDITGAATFDVAGHSAADLRLTGPVSDLSFTGWDTSTELLQEVLITLIQDTTGGHTFDWAALNGVWTETPPDPLTKLAPDDTSLQFWVRTRDGGASLEFEPVGISYNAGSCPTVAMTSFTTPAVVNAGDTVNLAHTFTTFGDAVLYDTTTGRKVMADLIRATPTDPASAISIEFAGAHPAGQFHVVAWGETADGCPPNLEVGWATWVTTTLQMAASTTVNTVFQHDGALGDVQIIPEFGAAPIDVTSGAPVGHTYAAAYTGPVTLRWQPGVTVTTMNDGPTDRWAFDVANLPREMTRVEINSENSVTGDIGSLPPTLDTLDIRGSNTISGDVATMPATMTSFTLRGDNSTSGLVSAVPAALTRYDNRGNNTTSGDIAGLPAGLTYYGNLGNNTTFGDVSTLPAGLQTYVNEGSNTTSGDVGMMPAGLETYVNEGSNTTSGNVGTLPTAIEVFSNSGLNTTSGDIGVLPATVISYVNRGANTATLAGAFNAPPGLRSFEHRPAVGNGLSPAQVDTVLAAVDALGTAGSSLHKVDLTGDNAAPTAAGLVSAANLTGRGWSIITTP